MNNLYAYFYDIDKAGLFYPVFVTEMTFLGGKVFARKKEKKMVYEEVRALVNFLRVYSISKLSEDTQSDFNGQYSKFSIRIVGKHYKIETQGKQMYLRNLLKIDDEVETIYLIGSTEHSSFINEVVETFLTTKTNYHIFKEQKYKAVIKDQIGNYFESDSYIVILRNKNVETYVR